MSLFRASPLLPAALLILTAACVSPVEKTETWSMLDGKVEAEARVHVLGEREAEGAVAEIRELISAVEHKMLAAGDESELARLNAGAAEAYHPVEDQDLYRCVLLALDYAKASNGAFDPTVGPLLRLYRRPDAAVRPPRPAELEQALGSVGWAKVAVADEARSFRFRRPGMRLDLGGVAKGFALDAAARAFARPGCLGGLLRIGGNFYAWGEAPDQPEWLVPLPDPRREGEWFAEVRLTNRGVAVTGHRDAEATGPKRRERVVLDPATGLPAAGDLLVAAAIADSAADADALSTALFVSGSMRGAELLERMRRAEAILLVRGEGEKPYVLASVSLKGHLELSPRIAEETGGRIRFLLPPDRVNP